jgi:hypothetical protein
MLSIRKGSWRDSRVGLKNCFASEKVFIFLSTSKLANISEIFNESARDLTEYSSSTFLIVQRFVSIGNQIEKNVKNK